MFGRFISGIIRREEGMVTSQALVGILMGAIALIMFPIVMDAANTIITNANIASFTGLESVAKVAPLIIFVGLLLGGGWLSWTGFGGRVPSFKRSSRRSYR